MSQLLYETWRQSIWSSMPKPPYEGPNPHPTWDKLTEERRVKFSNRVNEILLFLKDKSKTSADVKSAVETLMEAMR